ncbi:MAG: hypothetical protein K0S65_399 [Labilithrix sp.]|nr:hypothetical protein [Labilithrix sp.]
MKLSDLSDRELLRGLVGLLSTERRCVARLVTYLVEVEDRRLHLEDACSSLFDFCQRRLGLSEGEAFRRMTAARLVRRFPSVLGRLERGEIHLSALALLAKHLTEDNHEELLRAASHKSKREVQELLAARFPKDDLPSTIRLLPATNVPTPTTSCPTASASAHSESPSRKPSIEPLSAARYKVQFTATQELCDKLERAARLMSHRTPSGDLTVVVNEALDLLIADLEKRRLGKTARPKSKRAKSAKSGHVTRAALREVFERDGEQCSFVNEAGERCPARAFLEVDHVHPRAKGGAGVPENLRVLCRAHNQFAAERAFGREHLAKRIRLRQKKSRSVHGNIDEASPLQAPPSRSSPPPSGSPESPFELAIRALVSMGFREKEARRAVVELRDRAGATPAPATIERLLREALGIRTPHFGTARQLE